jgi:hypothetical protein
MLVRTPLRSYHFGPGVLNALWDPYADAKWYDIVAGARTRIGVWRTTRNYLGAVLKVLPRVLLSGFLAWLVADLLVIFIFLPTVDKTAMRLLTEERAAAVKAVQDRYNETLKSIDSNLAAVISDATQDTGYGELTQTKTKLETKIEYLHEDLASLKVLEGAEING